MTKCLQMRRLHIRAELAKSRGASRSDFAVMFSKYLHRPDVPVITEKGTPIPLSMFCHRNSKVKVQTAITEHAIICSAKARLAGVPYLAGIMKTVLILNIANLVDTTKG